MVKDYANQVRLQSLRKKAELFRDVQVTGDLADTHRRDEFMRDLLEVTQNILGQETVNANQMREVKEIEALSRPGKIASFLRTTERKAQ